MLALSCAPPPAPPAISSPQSNGGQTPSGGEAGFPITITDETGREFSLQKEPQRLVSLSAHNTEILYALNLEERVVAVDDYSDYPPAVEDKPRVGGFSSPDLEKIIAAEPDLVLASNIHTKKIVGELERHGLKVMVADSPDVKGVLDRIRLVGKATGRIQEAEALTNSMKARINAVEARMTGVKPVRVFYELSPTLHTAGSGTFMDDMIRVAGGINVAADAGKGWPQINQEALFLSDPEVILLGDHSAGETPEQVMARPGWNQITAVKDGRVHVVDPNLANRPGPRVVDGLDMVAKFIHPEKYQ
jgi:iron complex transport system substrate-binding protein